MKLQTNDRHLLVLGRRVGLGLSVLLIAPYLMAALPARKAPQASPSADAASSEAHVKGVKPSPRYQPSFARLDGGVWNLSEVQARAVLISFWGIWCEPCRREIPILQAMQTQLASRGVELVMANTDGAEFRDRLQKIAQEEQWTMPSLIDENGQACARISGAHITPLLVLMRPNGEVLWQGRSIEGEAAVAFQAAVERVQR